VSYWVGDWTVIIEASALLDVARTLRDAPDAAFDYCSDVTATDWPPRAKRFDVIYCLYSTRPRQCRR
jgi:NADH-quinone oxidoreductase subunit C